MTQNYLENFLRPLYSFFSFFAAAEQVLEQIYVLISSFRDQIEMPRAAELENWREEPWWSREHAGGVQTWVLHSCPQNTPIRVFAGLSEFPQRSKTQREKRKLPSAPKLNFKSVKKEPETGIKWETKKLPRNNFAVSLETAANICYKIFATMLVWIGFCLCSVQNAHLWTNSADYQQTIWNRHNTTVGRRRPFGSDDHPKQKHQLIWSKAFVWVSWRWGHNLTNM